SHNSKPALTGSVSSDQCSKAETEIANRQLINEAHMTRHLLFLFRWTPVSFFCRARMECGGKRSATPLCFVLTWHTRSQSKSGVALRLPPHSIGWLSNDRTVFSR